MNIKVSNFYYLTAGVLAILFAATHAWNGHSTVLLELNAEAISLDTQTIFTYVWHIITAENLICGIAFLFMSFQIEQSRNQLVAWVITALLFVRLIVILGVTAYFDAAALTATFVDLIAIVIYVILILLGARMKKDR